MSFQPGSQMLTTKISGRALRSARALYLFKNGVDTLYRIHGTNEDWSIGRSISSGCIRLLNQDIIDLHRRVQNGTRVVVLQQDNVPAA